MKKYLIKSCILATLLAGAFISCSDSDDVKPKVEVTWEEGAFILHEGSMGHNNSKLAYYNTKTNELVEDIFEEQNGKKLGDTAQDIIIYGEKMYITVNVSNMIYITDLKGKLVKGGEITTSNTSIKDPRYLAAHNGFVYISSYGGAVAKLDTTNLKIVGHLPTPKYSEKLAISDNKLFVGTATFGDVVNNTITVIDLQTFTNLEHVEVESNPSVVVNDDNNNIFICSPWQNKPLTKMDAQTYSTTTIEGSMVSNITLQKNRLLMYNMNYSTTPATATFSQYDIVNNKLSNTSFLKIETMPEAEKAEINKIYHISVDPKNYDIYVTTSDYSTTGSVYIFDEQGNYKKHFKAGGVGPQKTVFVSYKQQLID